jgi:hypothetical protein
MSREIQCVQGSPEWWAYRKGRPTASEFGRIVTPAKGEYSKSSDSYAAELIAAACGWLADFKGSPDTERGNYLEKQALSWLNFRHGLNARDCGFFLSDCGRYGASPDAIADDGCPVEIKCPALHTFLKWRIEGGLPLDHKAQCHGEMIVTGADKCYFLAYADNPHIDNMLVVVERDEYTEKLQAGILKFCDRLEELASDILAEEFLIIFPHLDKP